MNRSFGIKLAFLAVLFCYGASAGAEESSPVVVKVEKAIERGAHAAAHGVERGMEAASKGIKRGATATAHAARTVERKVGASPAPSSAPNN